MGMYTEVFVNVSLKATTPIDVIDTVKAIVNSDHESPLLADKPDRWSMMFNSCSYYFTNTTCSSLTKAEFSDTYNLIGKGDIKNYDSEIETFFEFIKPYCEDSDTFIEYHRYEEDREPTLIYS